MAELGQDGAAFAKAVMALRPYLGELVFVGGWAHRLCQQGLEKVFGQTIAAALGR